MVPLSAPLIARLPAVVVRLVLKWLPVTGPVTLRDSPSLRVRPAALKLPSVPIRLVPVKPWRCPSSCR